MRGRSTFLKLIGFVGIFIIFMLATVLSWRRSELEKNRRILITRTGIPELPVLPSNEVPISITPPTDNLSVADCNNAQCESACDKVMRDYGISRNSFIMALSYWEQLTMATNSMFGLINFARGWNARTVTPFTLNAEFYGLPSTVDYPTIAGMPPILKKMSTTPIDILYDMDKLNFNLLCSKYKLPPLASFEEFMRKASRKIVILHINFFQIPPKSVFGSKHYAQCKEYNKISSTGYKLTKFLNKESKNLNLPPFFIYAACCINHQHIIESAQEIAEACGFSSSDNLTAIFTVWRGYSDNPNKKFRLITSESPVFSKPSPERDAYPISKEIIEQAKYFRDYLSGGLGGGYISVHLRTAKIAMMDQAKANQRFKRCFEKAQALVQKEHKTIGKDTKELIDRYFVDYGRFGSHSYEVSLGIKASQKFLSKRHINPVHYNPDTYGGKLDQGYVALVEQEALAHSKVLILVGGGSFQEQMKIRFIQTGSGERVYKVCHTKEDLVELVYPSN